MKGFNILLLGFIIWHSSSLGQSVTITPPFIVQGLTFEQLSSYGFVQNSNYEVDNISSSNPASLVNFDTLTVGIGFQNVTNLNPGIPYQGQVKRALRFLPQSLGGVYPYGQFHFGAGMSQRYNRLLDFGTYAVTTLDNPAGTGETFNPTEQTLVTSFSGICSYSFPEVFYVSDVISVGAQINLDWMNYREQIFKTEAKGNTLAASFSLGVHYKYQARLNPGLFEIGLFFEKGSDLKSDIKFSNGTTLSLVDSSRQNAYNIDTPHWALNVKLPDKFNFGFIYSPQRELHLSINSRMVYWNKVDKNWKNSSQFCCSAIFEYSRHMSFSFGLFSSNPQYVQESPNEGLQNENYKTIYLTLGLHYQGRYFTTDVALADSHNYAGNFRKHTILKGAFSFLL